MPLADIFEDRANIKTAVEALMENLANRKYDIRTGRDSQHKSDRNCPQREVS